MSAAADRVAFVAAGAKDPPSIGLVDLDGSHRTAPAAGTLSKDFPLAALSVPKRVIFQAADGTRIHGQLFDNGEARSGRAKPAVIFVHGGPPRMAPIKSFSGV